MQDQAQALYSPEENLELEAFLLQEEIMGLARQAVDAAEIARKLSGHARKATELALSLNAEAVKVRLKIKDLDERFELFKMQSDEDRKKELDKIFEKA